MGTGIGVEKESHRQDILKAVQVLREKGGTHVYFILENPDYKEHNGIYADSNFFDRELPPVPCATTSGEEEDEGEEEEEGDKGDGEDVVASYPPQPLQPPGGKKVQGEEGYAEGRKAFVTYPKLQLTSIVRDKLQADSIDLLQEPYTNQVGHFVLFCRVGHFVLFFMVGHFVLFCYRSQKMTKRMEQGKSVTKQFSPHHQIYIDIVKVILENRHS